MCGHTCVHTRTPVCWQWEGRPWVCLGAAIWRPLGICRGPGDRPLCVWMLLPPSLPPVCLSPEAGRSASLRCRAVEDTKLQTLSLDGWLSCIKGPKVPGRSSDRRLRVKRPQEEQAGKVGAQLLWEGPFPCVSFGAWVTRVLPTQTCSCF